MVNGGVGILHEASAARGIKLETPNGIRTYRENIIKHFRTSIGNAMGAVNQRAALLDYQKRFYDEATERAREHPVKAYVFDAPGDAMRLHHFVELLNFHRIDVYELGRDVTEGGTTYRAGDALIVPLDQAQHTLIRSMFDMQKEFADSAFYDVSTWTFPLAFGLDYASLSGRRLNDNMLGQRVDASSQPRTPVDEASYAYAFEWSGYYAPRALYRILDAELLARTSLKPLSVNTTRGAANLSRGSIVVSFDRQKVARDDIHELMRTIAQEDGIAVHALTSGRSATDTPDVGGQFFKPLSKPKVLMIVGREMDWYNAGEIWHLLDVRMNMPVTLRDRSRLHEVNLNRYTHVVFVGGEYEMYLPEYIDRIRDWVNTGGTLIGLRQGALWAKTQVLDYVEPELIDGVPVADALPTTMHDEFATEELLDVERVDYAEKERREPLDLIGGAIFAGDLDVTHPLGFGYGRRQVALHKNMVEILPRTPNPYATVIGYATPPLLSGFTAEEKLAELEGTAALIAERKGAGSVILFADDPNFRGTWYGTNKLFLNALFLSKAFDPLPEQQ